MLEAATAVALSAAICYLGILAEGWLQLPGTLIPCATAITVVLATAMPRVLAPLVASGEGIATILMNIFLATVSWWSARLQLSCCIFDIPHCARTAH